MARPLRIDLPGAWYHVTARGNERQSIFRQDGDRLHFLELLEESVHRHGWRLHSYALMSTDQLTPTDRVHQALAGLNEPASVQQLQKLCGIRTAAVRSALVELSQRGDVCRDARGYLLKAPFPVSRPIDP